MRLSQVIILLAALSGMIQVQADRGGVVPLKPNVIRWATASEKDSFGYDVYRGLAEEGPFERINPEPIAGAGTTDIPQRYEALCEEADRIYADLYQHALIKA